MKKNCLGFTLIELLVVISIIGIIFVLGIAKYQEFNRRQIFTQAAQELKSNLRFAQDKALVGEKNCDTCWGPDANCGNRDDFPLEGWFWEPMVNGYEIYGRCGGAGNEFNRKIINLSQRGISILSSPSAIQFKPLGLGVVGDGTITLRMDGIDDIEVVVNVGGEIFIR